MSRARRAQWRCAPGSPSSADARHAPALRSSHGELPPPRRASLETSVQPCADGGSPRPPFRRQVPSTCPLLHGWRYLFSVCSPRLLPLQSVRRRALLDRTSHATPLALLYARPDNVGMEGESMATYGDGHQSPVGALTRVDDMIRDVLKIQ